MGILKGLVKTAANMSGLGLMKRQLGALGVLEKKKKAQTVEAPQPAASSYDSEWDSMDKADAKARREEASMLASSQDEAALQEVARLKKMRMNRLRASQGQ